ncbi:hypothetical protein M409DRAFT_26520 [Zasmidium cellare ATCC 36951]|uniref:Major facilitator superfamily (MFS) profile domain-containing protein n=1 Tax=Zasmidium cellare ATCC 36951 TaxID=1080233 RepID=A0A6A6C7K2_ZASCE|nr:uncharacterized protein M409DRAFT_26520 [Zasmidium cellare ATCC 36951]KAF2163074.1 hypothetical protein M409DRAFT_26520 [Zasmidium cellare ATCC 36951]
MDAEIELSPTTSQTDEKRASAKLARKHAYFALLGCSILQLPIWGIAMTFGIFQSAYIRDGLITSSSGSSGVIGTTLNGVMYLSMPILFTALDRGTWAKYRRSVAITGVLISSLAFLLSSFSHQLWHLVLTQGVLAALGSTMLYSPTTLYLDEHFHGGKATAYGATLSSKNIVGTCCPLMFTALLDHVGSRWTLRIWALMLLVTGIFGIAVIPTKASLARRSPAKVPWSFLRHKTFYVYCIANAVFSSGYGIPQTYLPGYARDVLHQSTFSGSITITLFNAPGILSCVGFGFMSDRRKWSPIATFLSAFGTSVCALFLWGLASNRIPGLLIAFSLGCGFFAGGYSSTWGGWVKDLEREAIEANEAINTGMLYGLLNGARGVGYALSGGVSGPSMEL